MEISSSNTSALNGLINLWGANGRPTVIEFKDSSGYHFYSQRNDDGSVSFDFNGIANFQRGVTSAGEVISKKRMLFVWLMGVTELSGAMMGLIFTCC